MKELPPKVELYDWTDAEGLRRRVQDGCMEELKSSFPASYGGVRMELEDLHYKDPDEYTPAQMRDAWLSDKFLSRRIRGVAVLKDDKTGEELDRKSMTLMRVPWITPRGTIIHNGSNYVAANQGRLMSGIYARRRENGQAEMHFNARRGTGSISRLILEPGTGQFRLHVGGSNLHFYSLLRDMGVSDEDLEKRWGKELLDVNRGKYDRRVLGKAYDKFVPARLRKPGLEPQDMALELRKAFKAQQAHEFVMRRNLPALFDPVKAAAQRKSASVASAGRRGFAPDLTPGTVCGWFGDRCVEVDPFMTPASLAGVLSAHAEKAAAWLDWLDWYAGFGEGKRGPEDPAMIRKWAAVRDGLGESFMASPTPAKAASLRCFAIDPSGFGYPAEAGRKAEDEWLAGVLLGTGRVKTAFALADYEALAAFLNKEHAAGIDVTAPATQIADQVRAFLADSGTDSPSVSALTGAARMARPSREDLGYGGDA